MRQPAAVALLLTLLAGPAAGQGAIPDGTLLRGQLSFDGRATAGDFTGTTSTVTGALTGAATLTDVRGWVEAPVTTLVTGNDRRDRDLNKSMESGKHPVMRFDLDGVEPGTGTPDSLPATLRGRLTLHGVTREVTLPAILSLRDDGAELRSTFPVNLKDYRIGGLSKFLGMFKMYEDIVVHVELAFQYQPAADTGAGSP